MANKRVLSKELLGEYIAETKIVHIGEEITVNYGWDRAEITPEQLEEMKQGGILWIDINDGEYICLVQLGGKANENDN